MKKVEKNIETNEESLTVRNRMSDRDGKAGAKMKHRLVPG